MVASKIALKLAIEAVSCGLEHDTVSVCEGDFPSPRSPVDCNGLVEEAFEALLDEVDEAMPFARFDRRIANAWAQAGSDLKMEMAAERYF